MSTGQSTMSSSSDYEIHKAARSGNLNRTKAAIEKKAKSQSQVKEPSKQALMASAHKAARSGNVNRTKAAVEKLKN